VIGIKLIKMKKIKDKRWNINYDLGFEKGYAVGCKETKQKMIEEFKEKLSILGGKIIQGNYSKEGILNLISKLKTEVSK